MFIFAKSNSVGRKKPNIFHQCIMKVVHRLPKTMLCKNIKYYVTSFNYEHKSRLWQSGYFDNQPANLDIHPG